MFDDITTDENNVFINYMTTADDDDQLFKLGNAHPFDYLDIEQNENLNPGAFDELEKEEKLFMDIERKLAATETIENLLDLLKKKHEERAQRYRDALKRFHVTSMRDNEFCSLEVNQMTLVEKELFPLISMTKQPGIIMECLIGNTKVYATKHNDYYVLDVVSPSSKKRFVCHSTLLI
jgi:hypothetical protein